MIPEANRFLDKAAFLRYRSKLQGIWEKFMSGKISAEDISSIPRRIVESWVRSKGYGLDPYHYEPYIEMKNFNVKRQTDRVVMGQALGYYLSCLSKRYGFGVSIFDVQGRKVSFLPNGDNDTTFISEMIAGTNSVALALLENKSSCVMMEEHYSISHHPFFCISAPFHDANQHVVGAVSFRTRDFEIVRALAELTEQVAPMCTLIFTLARQTPYKDDSLTTLLSKLANLSTPIQHIDDRKKLMFLNQHAKDLLAQQNPADNVRRKPSSQPAVASVKNKAADTPSCLPVLEWPPKTRCIDFFGIVGEAPALTKCIRFAKQAAQTDYAIILNGESGVGKELFAQSIHAASPRHNGPFVAVNCGAIASELVESELFGYEEGAFTGADQRGKVGLLEKASGGTLFLDEIESMPLAVQAKLLRVLSSGTLTHVGSTREIPVDLRVISASKIDLRSAAKVKKFREDLFYRISTVSLFIPPLRNRKDDIPQLIQHFLNSWGIQNFQIAPDALQILCDYHWPGNVRELENVLIYACVFSEQGHITVSALPDKLRAIWCLQHLSEFLSEHRLVTTERLASMNEIETELIRSALSENDYVITRTARALHIGRNTLRVRIRQDPELLAMTQRQSSNS